jgi:hypothetical protein
MHKQDLNLIWHPYAWSVCVLTADQYAWADFFKQRCKDDVYPAIRHIAELMQVLYNNTIPHYLEQGEWHLPFVSNIDPKTTVIELLLAKSASCCARISYANDKEEGIEVHVRRHDDCRDSKHSGVFEHQLRVPTEDELYLLDGERYEIHSTTGELFILTGKYHSNIKGWIQYRKVLGL